MSGVRRGDKVFEDYDHEDDFEKEQDELEKIHSDEEEDEMGAVTPPAKEEKPDNRLSKSTPVECEEVGCEKPAKKNWKGRKLCEDHYDQYRDQEQSNYTFYY